MDTINPWLDPTEVRQLAEKLIRPVEQSPVISRDPGFDTSFVGFVDVDEPAKVIAPVIPALTPVSVTVVPTPTPVASVSTSKLPSPLSKLKPVVKIAPTPKITTLLDSRFTSLRNHLTEELAAKEIFILDQAGSVIFDESHHGRLHFAARDLVAQSDHPQNIRVKFSPTANLELISCETPKGIVILGALFPNSLNSDQIASIRGAITQSLSA